MEALRLSRNAPQPDLSRVTPDVTEWDERVYRRITSTELSPEQRERILTPPAVLKRQEAILAVHWHPEFVPMELITERVRRMFPNAEDALIIPTQHNVLLELDGFAGVEIDCYSQGFNRKVQLLTHFAADRVRDATVFKAMLAHTFKYRGGQLYEFLDSLVEPAFEERVEQAAFRTGAGPDLIQFVRIHATKLKKLIERHERDTYPRCSRTSCCDFISTPCASTTTTA